MAEIPFAVSESAAPITFSLSQFWMLNQLPPGPV
jgi:hypothetical protein